MSRKTTHLAEQEERGIISRTLARPKLSKDFPVLTREELDSRDMRIDYTSCAFSAINSNLARLTHARAYVFVDACLCVHAHVFK